MQIPEIDYDSCPNNLGGSLRLWIEEGIECGGFDMQGRNHVRKPREL